MGEPEKKIKSQIETPATAKPGGIHDQPKSEAILENIALTLGELLFHVGSASKALVRLADKFAPEGPARSFPGRGHLKTCARGHGMQPTDDYCQACYAEDKGPRPAA